ncbi:retrovirus-related pol polyprotein from transposon TNT 1-94 [Tanacetum coccineum]
MLATDDMHIGDSRLLRYIDKRPIGLMPYEKCILTGSFYSTIGLYHQLSSTQSDPEQDQKGQSYAREFWLHCKILQETLQTYQQQPLELRQTQETECGYNPKNTRHWTNQTGQFGNQRAVNVVGARETVGGQVVQLSGIQCFNCKNLVHFAKECKNRQNGTDEEIDEQELEAHYSYMAKIQEVPNADSGTDAEPLEQWKGSISNVIPDSPNDSLAFIHELKQEMHADLKYVESLEDENLMNLNRIRRFSNLNDMLLQECVSKDVMCFIANFV